MLVEQFRPYRLDDIVGQDRAKRLIGSWLRTGRMPRSILISGETSAAKTTLARILARSMLCDEPDNGNCCGECKACKSFDDDTHPDYVEMNAAKDRGINDMRSLAQKVAIRPLLGKAKIIVLDEAHQITQPGWEAMLKTLEEPPPHVRYIVLTTEPKKIKQTILDRCSRVPLPSLTVDECVELLVKVSKKTGLGKAGLEKSHLKRIAKAAKGRPRKALHALEQVYTMVLDANDAGQTVSDSVVNTFIEDVAVTNVENLAGAIMRGILGGKPGGALKRSQDAWAEADELLSLLTEMMRQAMLLSTSPKLVDPYYEDLKEIDIFAFANPKSEHHLEMRKTILDAYACFVQCRVQTSGYSVPVHEVIGEPIARAALMCQNFMKSTKGTVKKAPPPAEAEPAETPEASNGTEAKEGGKVLRRKNKRAPAARLPS